MAAADSTVTPIRPKVEPVYFETDDGQPSIFRLINGLEGVCAALDRVEPHVGDADALDYIAQLSCAAQVLAHQLNSRWYGGKPPSRKRLREAREAQENWRRVRALADEEVAHV